ncbi:MAG: hypothetical protein WDM92_10790 [Caulobacteraceae bacterium]
MTREEVRTLVLGFPGTEEGTSYGHPSFKAFGKFLTRIRDEDDSLVLSDVGVDEREMLMEVDPDTFHVTPHYRNYPACWRGCRTSIRTGCGRPWSAAGASARRRRC